MIGRFIKYLAMSRQQMRRLREFKAAAALALNKPLDATPMQLNGPNTHPNIPDGIKVKVRFDAPVDPKFHSRVVMTFIDKKRVLATVGGNLRIDDDTIEVSGLVFSTTVSKFSHHAIRHFISVFKDLKNFSLSSTFLTNDKAVKFFENMGFEIVDFDTTRPAATPAKRAKLDYQNPAFRRLVFNRLELSESTPARAVPVTAHSQLRLGL